MRVFSKSAAEFLLVAILGLVWSTVAGATQVAAWTFEDGTANDSFGAYDLTLVGGGPSIAGGIATFDGDEGSPSFLETTGYGGSPSWTIALQLRSHAPFDQGNFQGVFSNNSSSSANYSWQVESFGGVYQFRTGNGVYVIGTPTGGFDSIVIRKTGGNDGDIWFNGVQVVANFGSNPGGLQNFRFGTNRNTNSFAAFDLGYAGVWDSFENPLLVPEPSSAILMLLGLAGLAVATPRAPRSATTPSD